MKQRLKNIKYVVWSALLLFFIPTALLNAGGRKDLSVELDKCKENVASLESENGQLKSQNEDLQSQITALEAQKAELEQKIALLESQIAGEEPVSEPTETEGEAPEPMIVSKTVEERMEEQKIQIMELTKEKEELESTVAQINSELAQLKAENQQLEKAMGAYEKIQEGSATLMDTALERIHELLKEEIESGKVRVFKGTMGIVIDVVGEYAFDIGSVNINSGGKRILKKVATLLEELDDYFIGIIGNADNKPIITPSLKRRFSSNWELSAHRGAVVVRYLLENSNISPKRITAMGSGEFQPIDDNTTTEGRGNNRRVDIVLLPLDLLSAVVIGAEIK